MVIYNISNTYGDKLIEDDLDENDREEAIQDYSRKKRRGNSLIGVILIIVILIILYGLFFFKT